MPNVVCPGFVPAELVDEGGLPLAEVAKPLLQIPVGLIDSVHLDSLNHHADWVVREFLNRRA